MIIHPGGQTPLEGMMKGSLHVVPVLLLAIAAALLGCGSQDDAASPGPAVASPAVAAPSTIPLPRPRLSGPLSLEEAIARRRSVREYREAAITLAEAAQVLWAAQGVTDPASGFRAAPSAGALYPLELYLVVRRVDGLERGVYHYVPASHALESPATPGRVAPADGDAALHERLCRAALSQTAVAAAPAVLVIAAVFERTTAKYGERGRDYVFMEAGHAAQNACLQAVALGLGSVVIGAFDSTAVGRVMGLAADTEPVYLVPLGHGAAQ